MAQPKWGRLIGSRSARSSVGLVSVSLASLIELPMTREVAPSPGANLRGRSEEDEDEGVMPVLLLVERRSC